MKIMKASKFFYCSRGTVSLVAILLLIMFGGASASPAPAQNDAGAARPASTPVPTEPAIEVKIDNFVFSPVVVTVKVGTQVTWINKDDIPHTVDSTEGKFKSAALDTDDKFQFRFTAPGEYPFYCRMHPKMTGKIVVQP